MKTLFATLLVGAAALSQATVIDTYPDWDGNITNGWQYVAQSFTAPSDNVLLNWTFGTNSQPNLGFSIFAWDPNSGPTSGALFQTTVNAGGGGDFTVSNINLALTTGNVYAVVYETDLNQSIHFQTNNTSYTGGCASWNNGTWNFLNSGWNTQFRAEFGTVPEPGTLAALALGALILVRRRR